MPLKPLVSNPSLDHFKRQARDLQKAHKLRDPEALQRIREFHPRLQKPDDAQIGEAPFTLADAQLTTAREHGFPSWARLRAHLDKGVAIDPNTPMHERIEDPVFRRAVELIDAGDERGMRSWLAKHPDLVRQRVYFVAGGYFERPTLMQFAAENPVRHGRLPSNIVAMVRLLLDAGAAPGDGTLALVASGRVPRECGVQVALIDLLCARGAEPKAMVAALTHGEFEAAEALLRSGAPLDLPTAAALGRGDDVRRLLSVADEAGRYLALALAAQHGRTEVVRQLLDAGEDPSRYNPVGAHSHSTPLHQAVVHGHLDTVRLLVERGARRDIVDTLWHGTPLGWAEYAGQTEIASYLQEAG